MATPQPSDLNFGRDGAKHFPAALCPEALTEIGAILSDLPPDQAGIRIHGVVRLRPFLEASGPIGRVAASVLGQNCVPVRAVLFDKTPTTNWSLTWHQDRTIVVVERIETEGFGPWSVKGGLVHVAPPFEVLARMVTLRVHLDPTPDSNAPLLVSPGSHRLGRIAEREVPALVRRCGSMACIADAGDVWLYATPILHASEAARDPVHRRVLQIDFAVGDLPGGLRWLGV